MIDISQEVNNSKKIANLASKLSLKDKAVTRNH